MPSGLLSIGLKWFLLRLAWYIYSSEVQEFNSLEILISFEFKKIEYIQDYITQKKPQNEKLVHIIICFSIKRALIPTLQNN